MIKVSSCFQRYANLQHTSFLNGEEWLSFFLLRFRKKEKPKPNSSAYWAILLLKTVYLPFRLTGDSVQIRLKHLPKKPQGRSCSVYNFVVTMTPIDFFSLIFLKFAFQQGEGEFCGILSACKALLDPWWINVWHTCIHDVCARYVWSVTHNYFCFLPVLGGLWSLITASETETNPRITCQIYKEF